LQDQFSIIIIIIIIRIIRIIFVYRIVVLTATKHIRL